MDRIKTAVVINGCGGDSEKQIRQLYSFVKENGLQAEFSVILSDNVSAEREILNSVWTREAAVIRLRDYFAGTAAELLGSALEGFGLILFPDNIFGSEVSVRLACRMHGNHLSRVCSLRLQDGGITCSRMVYSNLACADYEVGSFPLICSVASPPETGLPEKRTDLSCTVLDRAELPVPEEIRSWHTDRIPEKGNFEDARLVFVFGRGIGTKERLLEGVKLAESLGADYGVTRPVAMNGWAPLSRIVGVSGSQIHPKLCVVLGASGASAFYAGIEHSEILININTNESENLQDHSDLLIVGDCGEILRALREMLEKAEGGKPS
jgi:electron transfer flavoprotein alpha subunit